MYDLSILIYYKMEWGEGFVFPPSHYLLTNNIWLAIKKQLKSVPCVLTRRSLNPR